MRFQLVTQQLLVEEGEVSLAPTVAALSLGEDLTVVRVRDNITEDLPYVDFGASEASLLFRNCLIRSLGSGTTYRILGFHLTMPINKKDVVGDLARLELGFHGFARVQAVDRNSRPLSREHRLGVALSGVSIEAVGPIGTPLCVLLPPGEYFAYLVGSQPVQVPFVINEGQEDIGMITIQEPKVEALP